MDAHVRKPFILYAEDDQDDFEAVREALEQINNHQTLFHVRNGTEAVTYLERSDATLPDLIVLDLNMPVMDGKEVLSWLKAREKFQNIPIMIFTTSSREDDVKLCQKYSCTFFRKPTLYRDLLHVTQIMLQMCGQAKTNS